MKHARDPHQSTMRLITSVGFCWRDLLRQRLHTLIVAVGPFVCLATSKTGCRHPGTSCSYSALGKRSTRVRPLAPLCGPGGCSNDCHPPFSAASPTTLACVGDWPARHPRALLAASPGQILILVFHPANPVSGASCCLGVGGLPCPSPSAPVRHQTFKAPGLRHRAPFRRLGGLRGFNLLVTVVRSPKVVFEWACPRLQT